MAADPHLIRRGDGEPLLLVHGIHHSAQAWEPMLDQLAARFDVLVVDLPGHGGAPALEQPPSTDALADHLEGRLDDLGLGRVHVAGNSMGGLLALRLGERGRARSVTAFSPGGMVRPGLEHRWTRLVAQGLILRLSPRLRHLDILTDTVAGRTLALTSVFGRPDLVDPSYARGAMEAVAQAVDPHRTMDEMDDWHPDVKPIDVPVTIAWGTRDRLLFPRQGLRWKAALPDARLVRLPTLGHLPMGEDPDVCVNLIVRTAGMDG